VRNRLEGAPFEQGRRETDRPEPGLRTAFPASATAVCPCRRPFDAKRGVIPTRDGRIVDAAGAPIRTVCGGMDQRGPTGIIRTNRADSVRGIKSCSPSLCSAHESKCPLSARVERSARSPRIKDSRKVRLCWPAYSAVDALSSSGICDEHDLVRRTAPEPRALAVAPAYARARLSRAESRAAT